MLFSQEETKLRVNLFLTHRTPIEYQQRRNNLSHIEFSIS